MWQDECEAHIQVTALRNGSRIGSHHIFSGVVEDGELKT